jgi:hypothetical protein
MARPPGNPAAPQADLANEIERLRLEIRVLKEESDFTHFPGALLSPTAGCGQAWKRG